MAKGFESTLHPVVEPVTTDDPHGHGTTTTHPSFAQISGSRISGRRVLYGSDFEHNGFIRLRIARSTLKRDLAHDWHHDDINPFIEVDLSEAQWASFVSGLNVGGGVPCTLNYVKGEGHMPDLPLPSRTEQFQGEVDERLKIITDEISAAMDLVDELGLPKGKAAQIKERLSHAHMTARANVPFVAKSFGEHMERTVEKAKVEVHGYMNGALRQAGLEQLQSKSPLALNGPATNEICPICDGTVQGSCTCANEVKW